MPWTHLDCCFPASARSDKFWDMENSDNIDRPGKHADSDGPVVQDSKDSPVNGGNGNQNNTRIDLSAGWVLMLWSVVMSVVAIWAVAYGIAAAERASIAERSAALSRAYAVSAFFQTQVEWAKRGVVLESPLEHHAPIAETAFESHDQYVEKNND